MVAAGGAAAAATGADAAITTTFDIAPTASPTPVNLAGADAAHAQYSYGDFGAGKFKIFGWSDKQGLQANGGALIGNDALAPTMPSAGESFAPYTYATVLDKGGPILNQAAENYLHLEFTEAGQSYIGYADIAGNSDPGGFPPATLKSVTFQAAVPEPDTWALMICGLGLAGAAIRRQRRVQLQAAAA